jgi:3-dehydroquinate synthase
MKAEIVVRDERESGDRALLNFGHTFGHALEAATGYGDRLLHGEAVAIGMVLAFRLSAELGLCRGQDVERFARHLKDCGLPITLAEIPGARHTADDLLSHMAHDKKAKGGQLTFVLARAIGQAFVTSDVPLASVRKVLAG